MTLSPAELLDPSRFAPIYRTCPLCGAEDVHYEFLVERTPFARCSACTLLFANPVRSDAARAGAIIARDVADALLHFGERVLGRPADRVLFVGDSPAEVRGERRELGDLGTAQYDLIVAHGALEFAADPVAAAVAMRERLADDGLLVVLAPSISSREAIRRREDWAHLRRHARWYFDVDTLQLTLTRAGLGDFVTIAEAEDAGAATPGLRDFFGSHIAVFARGHVTYVPRLLSVIVPVYNEASTVAELLDRVLAKTIDDVSIEVVIVESNSSDGSREIVQRYAGHDRVRLVLEERPRGKGYAVRTGLKAARGEVVLFQDADLEYDVNDYDQLVEPLFARRRNFILGSRHDPQGDGWKIRRFDERKSVALTMNLAHIVLLVIFNTLYGQSLRDPFTMYKVFRRDCLGGLTFECNRFDFDYEITIKLLRKGYHVQERLVNYQSRSFSEGKKVAFFRDPPTWIRAMLRLKKSALYGSYTRGAEEPTVIARAR